MPRTKVYEKFCQERPVWHFHVSWQAEFPGLFIQGRERQYIRQYYDRSCVNASAISPVDVDHYTNMFERAGSMSAGFDADRAFHKDAEENRDYVAMNGKCTVPCMPLNGEGSFLASTAEEQDLDAYKSTETVKILRSRH